LGVKGGGRKRDTCGVDLNGLWGTLCGVLKKDPKKQGRMGVALNKERKERDKKHKKTNHHNSKRGGTRQKKQVGLTLEKKKKGSCKRNKTKFKSRVPTST